MEGRRQVAATALKNTWTIDQLGLLRWNNVVYVPNDLAVRQELLRIHHDDPLAGHFGSEKTTELLRRKFYWKNMANDVQEYVKSCKECQRNKPRRHRPYGELSQLPMPKGPWKEITMDLITGLPESEYRGTIYDAILVVMCRYTKMAIYIRTQKTITSNDLADLLMDNLIRHHGVPEGIVTDRGSIFTSSYWSNICYYLKIQRKLSTAFHPQTDGQTERQNQTVEAYLRMYCNEQMTNWARLLGMAEFTYNNAKHSSTGISPFYTLTSTDPPMPY